jgi:hypothetical protein
MESPADPATELLFASLVDALAGRQNNRQPARCQRTTVSGRTTSTQDRQSHNLDSQARLNRVAASIRRGFASRSLKSASWRRRTRFSASIDRRGLTARTSKPIKSATRRRTMRARAITPTSCHGSCVSTHSDLLGLSFCAGQPIIDVGWSLHALLAARCSASESIPFRQLLNAASISSRSSTVIPGSAIRCSRHSITSLSR